MRRQQHCPSLTQDTLSMPEGRQEAASFPKVQTFAFFKNNLKVHYKQRYSELPLPHNKHPIKREKRRGEKEKIALHALLFSTNCS